LSPTAEHFNQVRALLETQRYAVLSTRQGNGHPYGSLVAFSAAPDLTHLVFCTLRATRKYANLGIDARVSLLIDNRSNAETDLQRASAVTVLGTCQEPQGPPRERLLQSFLAQHPSMADFVRAPSCAVMRVDVRAYFLVTRFQNVVELHIQQGEQDAVDTPSR